MLKSNAINPPTGKSQAIVVNVFYELLNKVIKQDSVYELSASLLFQSIQYQHGSSISRDLANTLLHVLGRGAVH